MILFLSDGTTRIIRLNKDQSHVDLGGLLASTDYRVALKIGYDGTELASLPLTFKTGSSFAARTTHM